MKKGEKDLTSGNIKRQLYQLGLPMLAGMMGIVIFQLADTYFIGRLGVNELAAVSFCFPVIMFVNSLSHGFGIGTSAIISQNIFSQSREKVRLMASRALMLGVAVVVIFVVFGLMTIEPLFTALGTEKEIMPLVKEYMNIWYFGVIFVVMPMIGNNIVRATGNTTLPGMLMVSSAVINIILDPIMIFGWGVIPAMGIKGAALATVIARSTGLIFILIVLIGRSKLLTLKLGKIKDILGTWNKLIYIAAPASLAILISPISAGLITRILSGYGKEAVAAFGVATRVEMFALMVIASLGSVLIIFIGQNLSKKKFDRIFTALKYSMVFSLAWGGLMYLVLLGFGYNIASVFSDSTGVTEISANYFYIAGLGYGLLGMSMLSGTSFNGVNKPFPAAFFSLLKAMIFVLGAWITSIYFGLTGIFVSALVSSGISGIVSYKYLKRTIGKIQNKAAENEI